jgi:hypothetical protein
MSFRCISVANFLPSEGKFPQLATVFLVQSDVPPLRIPVCTLRFALDFESFVMKYKSRDSSVGIALGYGLDDRGSRVRFPAGAGNFSLHHSVQNGSGTHPASYPMGTRGPFLGGIATGA